MRQRPVGTGSPFVNWFAVPTRLLDGSKRSTPGPATTDLRNFVRDISDFPKPGILFKDITPLLSNPEAFRATITGLKDHFAGRGIDVIAAAEARGFIFGAPLALEMNAGFAPIRKPGKLPYARIALGARGHAMRGGRRGWISRKDKQSTKESALPRSATD